MARYLIVSTMCNNIYKQDKQERIEKETKLEQLYEKYSQTLILNTSSYGYNITFPPPTTPPFKVKQYVYLNHWQS